MNKKIRSTTAMLTISIGLLSCSVLQSPHYVGEKIDISEEDLSNQSIWVHKEDVYYVRRTGTNTFLAATMKWDAKKSAFTVHSFPLFLSELGDHLFLNIKNGDLYTILRVACCDDESIILFTVDLNMMKQEIADGKVKAHEDDGNIIMGCSKEEQDEYISNNIHHIFHMDGASIARKLSEEKKSASPSGEQKRN